MRGDIIVGQYALFLFQNILCSTAVHKEIQANNLEKRCNFICSKKNILRKITYHISSFKLTEDFA